MEHTVKQESAALEPQRIAAPSDLPPEVALHHEAATKEDASRYCPVCSQRLESRRCKLICSACGYYMSCADYY